MLHTHTHTVLLMCTSLLPRMIERLDSGPQTSSTLSGSSPVTQQELMYAPLSLYCSVTLPLLEPLTLTSIQSWEYSALCSSCLNTCRLAFIIVLYYHSSDLACVVCLFQVVRFHPNGRYIATGSSDRTCRLWDIQNGQCMRLMPGSKVQ